jgi:hypothetical protein
LLTKAAREKIAGTDLSVAPKADDRAKFEIQEVVYPTPEHDIAHVPALWIVPDETTGQPRTDKATWICRLEKDGWRVAALAAYIFEGEPPLLLNFENPREMAEKQQWLEKEIERRSKEETAPTASGENSSQAEQKPRDAFRR